MQNSTGRASFGACRHLTSVMTGEYPQVLLIPKQKRKSERFLTKISKKTFTVTSFRVFETFRSKVTHIPSDSQSPLSVKITLSTGKTYIYTCRRRMQWKLICLLLYFLHFHNKPNRNTYIRMCEILVAAIQNGKLQIVQLIIIVLPASEELLNSAKMT